MEPSGDPRVPPVGGLEKLSPSISLLRRIAGMTPRAHDEFMSGSRSGRAGGRGTGDASSRRRGDHSPASRQYYSDQHVANHDQTTIMLLSPKDGNVPSAGLNKTPEKKTVHYADMTITATTPEGAQASSGGGGSSVAGGGGGGGGNNDHGNDNANESTKTPTTRQMNRSRLKQCFSSCSSLRFNPASLVSMPFVYCNNTFIKLKVDDVFDLRVGRRRTKSEYASTTDAGYSQHGGVGGGRTGRRQVNAAAAAIDGAADATVDEALRIAQMQIHNDYAMNPYKRRYENTLKERRRLACSSRVESIDEMAPVISPVKKTRKYRPRGTKQVDHQADNNRRTSVCSKSYDIVIPEDDTTLAAATFDEATPICRKLAYLAEEERPKIENLCIVRRNVDSQLMAQVLDVLKVASAFKQLVRGSSLVNGAVRESLLNICKDVETLSEMASVVKSLLREAEDSIIVLQYSKALLNGHGDAIQMNGVKHGMTIEQDGNAGQGEGTYVRKGRNGSTATTPVHCNRDDGSIVVAAPTAGKDVVVTSPCIALTCGLACIQGRCSTSTESFNGPSSTDCYAAAGCYLWDSELMMQRNGCPDITTTAESAATTGSGDGDPLSLPSIEPQVAPPNYKQDESDTESEEIYAMGKTGPWTSDPSFSEAILEQNRIREFNSIKGFLKDVCRVGVAEIRFPNPDWSVPSEYRCFNDMCCTKCCTCKDGLTDPEMLLNTSQNTCYEENVDTKIDVDIAMARMEVHKTLLGKCLCVCRCVSDQSLIDRVVHEHTTSYVPSNNGLIWHDMEPNEHVIDARSKNLVNDGFVQERFTLRIRTDRLPHQWKERAPFICKLELDFSDGEDCTDESGKRDVEYSSSGGTLKDIDRPNSGMTVVQMGSDNEPLMNDMNNGESHLMDDAETVVNESISPQCGGASQETIFDERNIGNWRLTEFKQLTEFTFWDAIDIMSKQQRVLHTVLSKCGESMDCFDPLEIDTAKVPVEKLKLDRNSLVIDPTKEDYVDVALYLPYVPSCTLPWRFESIAGIDLLETKVDLGPQVEVQCKLNAVTDFSHESGSETVVPYQHACLQSDVVNTATPIPSNYIDCPEKSTPIGRNAMFAVSESNTLTSNRNGSVSTSINGGDDTSRLTSIANTPKSFKDYQHHNKDANMTKEALICAKLLRSMVVVSEEMRRVMLFLREHTLMRNHVLRKEAEACKIYRRAWHRHLVKIKKSLPKVDIFAWGVLPVRATDMPDQFVPLPAGYRQDDINWPYVNNNMLSPFEVEGYGIGDLENKNQCFSAMRQGIQDKHKDNPDLEQIHTTRKPAIARRRLPATEVDPVDPPDEEMNRATVWLAPSYSNLTGPGIRWTYSCMDTVSEPMHCIPDFSVLPIYKTMKCPEYGFYKLDHNVQYDRCNALTSQAVIDDDLMTSISNMWTRNECRIFIEKYLMYPKNFAKIAQFIETKRCGECVAFYYRFKYRLKLKERLKDLMEKPKNKYEMTRFLRRDVHVMKALDSLFDDCYTEKMREICEQNSIAFTGINDYMLHTVGVDTGRKYEIALTQHRGNWSPLDEEFPVLLDNLNEGYFLPTKYRCLVSRKGLELPFSDSNGNNETIVKRGCVVINGKRDFEDPDQLKSLISAIKTEHILSLKPLYCRRITGRSILDALFQYSSAINQVPPPEPVAVVEEVEDGAESDGGSSQDDNASESFGVEEYKAAAAPEYEERCQVRLENWSRADYVEPPHANYRLMHDIRNLSIPLEYPVPHSAFPMRRMAHTEQHYQQQQHPQQQYHHHYQHQPLMADGRKDPRESSMYADNYAKEDEEDHDDMFKPRNVVVPMPVRTRRKRRPAYKTDDPRNDEIPAMETQVSPIKGSYSHRYSGNPDFPRGDSERAYCKTITEWSETEVAEFVRLFHIYGEDWDSIARGMAMHGKTKEEIIDYYVKRLTNNAMRRNAQTYYNFAHNYGETQDYQGP